MTHRIERLPNEPIIVVSWSDPIDLRKESAEEFAQIDALIGTDERACVINDMSNLKLDFNSIVTGLAAQTPKVPGSSSDPRTKTIVIGSGAFMNLIAAGAKKMQYAESNYCTSMEDALVIAREKLKSW